MLELICVIIINALIKVIFEDNWKPFIVLVILYLFCSFMGSLSQQKTYCHLQIILQIAVGFLFILNHLSTCFCNQHPVNLLLHCFLCIFIEMITDNIDCLPDFLCKCVTLCFCIHHFSFLLEPQQRVIPLVSVRTLFFQSGPKWALPVSQATYIQPFHFCLQKAL